MSGSVGRCLDQDHALVCRYYFKKSQSQPDEDQKDCVPKTEQHMGRHKRGVMFPGTRPYLNRPGGITGTAEDWEGRFLSLEEEDRFWMPHERSGHVSTEWFSSLRTW